MPSINNDTPNVIGGTSRRTTPAQVQPQTSQEQVPQKQKGMFDRFSDSAEQFGNNLGLPALSHYIKGNQAKLDAEAQRPFQFDPRTGRKVFTDRANTLLEDRHAALDEMNEQGNKGWVKL